MIKNRKLVVSTNNQDKIREIKDILKDLPIEVMSKKEVGLENISVIESGASLEENSILKAKALAEKVDYMILADDSGLFVDILGGQPGVFSSRYAGEEGNSSKNNLKLVEELKDIPIEERTASFKAAMVLITENKDTIVVHGQCKGTIGYELTSGRGFGYDPLFWPEGYNNSFAELGEDIKNKISHRANALSKIKVEIERLLEE